MASIPVVRTPHAAEESSGLTGATVTMFAVVAGLSVANIFYAQPLLPAIARSFGAGVAGVSLVAVLGTVGYVAGLALVVPLGDMVDKRWLSTGLLVAVSVCQGISACATKLPVLVAAATVMSFCAVVAPLMVSFAAGLATSRERGRVTGTVMSGVLVEVLLARTGGGLVAHAFGSWRAVYAVACAVAAVAAIVIARGVPDRPAAHRVSYPRLLGSVFHLLVEEPVLRRRCAYGFLGFAAFNAFWVASSFLLSVSPYGWGEARIGLLGLVGLAGVVAARLVGGWVDRRRELILTLLLFLLILAGFLAMSIRSGHSLSALVVGVLLLDMGSQGLQTTNLSVSFRVRPDARSRITTAYMTSYFLGGAAGSVLASICFVRAGWLGITTLGVGFALTGVLLWLGEYRSSGRLDQ